MKKNKNKKKLSHESFWEIVDSLDWEKSVANNPDYHLVLRETLLPLLPNKQLKRSFLRHLGEAKMLLFQVTQLDSAAGSNLNPRDAVVHGVLTHLVACGYIKYGKAMGNPQLVIDLIVSKNYSSTFENSLPLDSAYDTPPPIEIALESDVAMLKKEIIDCEKKLFSLRRKLAGKINQLEKSTKNTNSP